MNIKYVAFFTNSYAQYAIPVILQHGVDMHSETCASLTQLKILFLQTPRTHQ